MNSSILSKSKNIGLLVVDEGHRLKNTSGSLTLSSLQSLNCKARLLITGTPVQNNLAEFYNVVNFAIPGVLGDLKSFRQGKSIDHLHNTISLFDVNDNKMFMHSFFMFIERL